MRFWREWPPQHFCWFGQLNDMQPFNHTESLKVIKVCLCIKQMMSQDANCTWLRFHRDFFFFLKKNCPPEIHILC
jgi:hypothetical protein